MRLSLLVVSRTPVLLSRMLASIATATDLPYEEVEILCSWNGKSEEEHLIENSSGYEFLIAQRDPYHFASNMNGLADKARGNELLFINDDLVLDRSSIDAALACLNSSNDIGIVGSRLRDEDGVLTHAGIVFDSRHSPYHQLDRIIASDHPAINRREVAMPAVTGALFLIRNEQFQAIRFRVEYLVCGEDVELCLDVRERLGLKIVYCPRFSGIHASEATRSNIDGQDGNSEDMSRMRIRRKQFLDKANRKQLSDEVFVKAFENDVLRSLDTSTELKDHQKELKEWQQKCHSLQLTRLRLEQALKQVQQTKSPTHN